MLLTIFYCDGIFGCYKKLEKKRKRKKAHMGAHGARAARSLRAKLVLQQGTCTPLLTKWVLLF
jgi:hypothetical protein